MDKKEVRINSKYFKYFFISLLVSFTITVAVQYFGEFQYVPQTKIPSYSNDGLVHDIGYYSSSSTLNQLYFKSVFGNMISLPVSNYTVGDVQTGGSLHSFSESLPVYIKITFKEFNWVLLFTAIIYGLSLLFWKVKLKIV